MKFTKLLMQMLPTVEPWVVPGENVKNPGGVDNVNPLDTLSSDLHPWGGRVRAPGPVTRTIAAPAGGGACGRDATLAEGGGWDLALSAGGPVGLELMRALGGRAGTERAMRARARLERTQDEVAYGLRPAPAALEECGRRCGLVVARLAGRGEPSERRWLPSVECSTKKLALCRSPRWSTPRLTTSSTARPAGRRVPMVACGLAKVFVLSR